MKRNAVVVMEGLEQASIEVGRSARKSSVQESRRQSLDWMECKGGKSREGKWM